MPSSLLKKQLHQFHNPFAKTTHQPKIPDGKTTQSLGFSVQSTGEVYNNTETQKLHIFLFAGQNAGVVFFGTDPNLSQHPRKFYVPSFAQDGGLDATNLMAAAADMKVTQNDSWVYWRVVSCGLQLKMLNVAEEDDGWWEAVRISRASNPLDYFVSGAEGVAGSTSYNHAVAHPAGQVISDIQNKSLSNENSYSTGLVRDLAKVQFNLHGQKDHHDFNELSRTMVISQNDRRQVPNTANNYYGTGTGGPLFSWDFTEGSEAARRIIDSQVDSGYDMIYIRVHCRKNSSTATENGTRLHFNCASNQEVVFSTNAKESRYMTSTSNIGAAATTHAAYRNMGRSSAHRVSP